jgi:hypothetical protein
MIEGRLIISNTLDLILPKDWAVFSVNGVRYIKTNTRMSVKIQNPTHEISDIEISKDGLNWTKNFNEKEMGEGKYFLRFIWPGIKAEEKHLLLSGLGAKEVIVMYKNKKIKIPAHNYRDVVLGEDVLKDIKPGDVLTIIIDRDNLLYVDKTILDKYKIPNSLTESKKIIFKRPEIFAPLDIKLSR